MWDGSCHVCSVVTSLSGCIIAFLFCGNFSERVEICLKQLMNQMHVCMRTCEQLVFRLFSVAHCGAERDAWSGCFQSLPVCIVVRIFNIFSRSD